MTPRFIWGVDPGTRRIAVAFWDSGEFELRTIPIEGKGAARLAHAHQAIRGFAANVGESFPPLAVFVEQPSGRFRNLPLTYMAGVVQAGLHVGLSWLYEHPVSVWTIPPKEWKKLSLGEGHGNASKAEVMAWAKGLGYTGTSEDEADALAIAYAGAVVVGRQAAWRAAA